MQGVQRKALEISGEFVAPEPEMVYTGKTNIDRRNSMKLKNTKLFLCGILAALFLARNIQDSQFVMSFFFAVVAWQCLRAAFEAKGFEEGEDRQGAFRTAAGKFYVPLAGVAWMLPYGVMILCAAVGAVIPGLQMVMLWVFIAAVVVHSACEVMVWKKAAKEK